MANFKTRRKVPDVIRRTIRQALGIGFAVFVGYFLQEPLEGTVVKAICCRGAKWCAITVIVVAAPVIGKVAQVSIERTLGTIIGGVLGYFAVIFNRSITLTDMVIFGPLSAAAVAAVGVLVGRALRLEYSAKLFCMTYILVLMGADEASDAFLVAITRIGGIVGGVMITLVLAVTVFPKSASHEAADSMSAALQGLLKLYALAWSIDWASDDAVANELRRRGSNGSNSAAAETLLRRVSKSSDTAQPLIVKDIALDADCEKTLMDVYSKLDKCTEYIPLSRNEFYFTTLRGRWCFLPALPFLELGKWKLPQSEMIALATSVRRVARILFFLHLTFEQAFDGYVKGLLRRRYPPELMTELQTAFGSALADLADAFPDKTYAQTSNMQTFLKVTHDLLALSEKQRRATMNIMNRLSRQTSRVDGKSDIPMTPLAEAPELAVVNGGLSFQRPNADNGHVHHKQDQASGRQSTDPLIDAEKLDGFPDTSHGFTSKIRWYSFQFLMQQLADELNDTFIAMSNVLAALPQSMQVGIDSIAIL